VATLWLSSRRGIRTTQVPAIRSPTRSRSRLNTGNSANTPVHSSQNIAVAKAVMPCEP